MAVATIDNYSNKMQLGFFTIRNSMIIGAALIIAGIIAASISVYTIVGTYRIGSDNYLKIEEGKDFVADALPPPLTPYQAALIMHSLDIIPESEIPKQLAEEKQLHHDFNDRLAHWEQVMTARGKMSVPQWKEVLTGLRNKGDVFWKALEEGAIPALTTKAANSDEAVSKAMKAFYDLETVVTSSIDFLNNDVKAEEQANIAGSNWGAHAVTGIFAAILALVLALSVMGLKKIVGALQKFTRTMAALAGGALDAEIPFLVRRDEIGAMAQALSVFKAQAEQIKEDEAAKSKSLIEMKQHSDTIAANEEHSRRVIVDMGRALRRLASGDLTCAITEPFAGSLDELRQRFNESLTALQLLITTVQTGTSGINTGTQEIANASDDLARRTETQAATLEETAAAVAEITGKVKKTAHGAVRAKQVVEVAKNDADESGAVVTKAIGAMQEIHESSQKITQIVSMIDEIAFQTNLLALNAGVEAARAGDAGRGFAVVASEVRALAQRSAGAAKEIKQILAGSQVVVEQGVHLVSETGLSLKAIIDRVAEINTVISEIAQNAEEQASGLNEVNLAVSQMDQATQQNAAMVEETTAATRMLTEQSMALAKLVSSFTTAARTQVEAPPVSAKKIVSLHQRARAAGADGAWSDF